MGFWDIAAFIIIPVGVIAYFIWRKRKVAEVTEKASSLDNGKLENGLSLTTPPLKQALTKYSVKNASELRRLKPAELVDLLSRSSAVIKVFENRISEIMEVYEEHDNSINNMMASKNSRDVMAEKLRPARERLERQLDQAMTAFDIERTLGIIPAQYRMSVILDTLCKYLSDGEAGSWEDCIRIYKEDMHRMEQNAKFNTMINLLGSIDRNTKMAAFFSGVTAMNTARIASRF